MEFPYSNIPKIPQEYLLEYINFSTIFEEDEYVIQLIEKFL
jgi:hypothetical protein